jgi:hypothetical protein
MVPVAVNMVLNFSYTNEDLIPKIEILLAGKTGPEKVLNNNFIMEGTRETENQ